MSNVITLPCVLPIPAPRWPPCGTTSGHCALSQPPKSWNFVDVPLGFPSLPPPQVAILCNHQRAVPKGHQGQMEKLQEKLGAIQDEIDVSGCAGFV